MKFYRDPETQKVKLTTSQKIKCSFFMFVMFLSALGAFGYGVLPFSPFPITRGYATAAGFISFLFYAFVVFWFVVENLPHKSKLYKTLHICGGWFVFLFMSVFLSYCFSKTIPYFYTRYYFSGEDRLFAVYKKEVRGKGNNEYVYLTGVSENIPVSRSYYNSVQVGQIVKAKVYKSKYGLAIDLMD